MSENLDIKQRYRQPDSRSKYHVSYCQMVQDHMGQGLSFDSFAGAIGVTAKSLYNWKARVPEFKTACDKAKMRSLLFWEKVLVDGATGEIKSSASLLIFKLKNAFPTLYSDKSQVEHTNMAPTQIIFSTGIVREGDAGYQLEDTRKKPVVENVEYKEIEDEGEDLL